MNVMVPLQLICDAIESANSEWKQYLDIENMEVVCLPEYSFMGEYDEKYQELADTIEEERRARFFALPSQFDIHEYSIMERFVWDLPQGRVQDSLEYAIRGKRAFRRFKDAIRRFGIEQQWYDFKAKAYRKLAMEWCDEHGFTYCEVKGEDKEKVQTGINAGADPTTREAAKDRETRADAAAKENLAWKEIRTEHVVQDEWIDFRRSAYQFPDGNVFQPFYSYSRKDYVVIVARDEDGNYLCVRQFRQGVKQVTTEFPAGGIERSDGREYKSRQAPEASEDAFQAAKRELLEETGYASEEWRYLLTVPSNATMADNYAHIFEAKNCRKSGEQNLDETEFLHVKKYSPKEIEKLIFGGEFQQAVHIMAWLLAGRE